MHSELLLAFVTEQSPQLREHPKSLYDPRVHTYSSWLSNCFLLVSGRA